MKITNAALGKLALTAVIMIIVTAVVFGIGGKMTSVNFAAGAPLVQGLDAAQIAKITVREKAKEGDKYESVTLTAKDNDQFIIAEKFGYPADNEEINELLRTVLDIRTAVKLADTPGENAEFGVAGDKPATASVAFFSKDGKELLHLNVGAVNGRGHNVTTGREVYRSEAPVEISAKPLSFIDQTVLKIDSKKVKSIAVERTGGEKYSFAGKDGVLKMQNLPAGKEENDSESWGLKDGFTRLTFDDVEPANRADVQLTKMLSAVVTMEDGGIYRLQLFKNQTAGDYKVTVAADEPRRDQLTPEKLVVWENAVRFNRTHQGWRFSISKWEGERLDLPLSKLLKDAPKPEKTSAPAAAKPEDKPSPAAVPHTPQPASAEKAAQ